MLDLKKENIRHKINYFFQKIHVPEYKFKVAQFLFILSIACGWYLPDIIRRLLFLSALLLTSKKQRQIPIIKKWRGMVKVAGYCTIIFGSWILLIPLIFGVDPFLERVLSLARPLEVGLWIWGTLIFARNDFYKKNIRNISILSCSFLVVVLFVQRLMQSFASIYDHWSLCGHAAWAAIAICTLLPWVLYDIISKKTRTWTLYLIFILSITVVISTYMSTMWIALFIQMLLLVILLLKSKKYISIVQILFIIALCFLLLLPLYKFQSNFKQRVNAELAQLSNFNKNIKTFTSQRNYVWKDVINLIKQRKTFGYGWTEYNEHSTFRQGKNTFTHPHSSYLQAAFYTGIVGAVLFILTLLSLFIVGLKSVTNNRISSFPFVVTLAIAAFATAGLTDAYFFVGREVLIPFWSTAVLLLTPVNNKHE